MSSLSKNQLHSILSPLHHPSRPSLLTSIAPTNSILIPRCSNFLPGARTISTVPLTPSWAW